MPVAVVSQLPPLMADPVDQVCKTWGQKNPVTVDNVVADLKRNIWEKFG